MQKFFVASLFLMFSCYGGENSGTTTEPLKKKPQAVIRPIPQRPDLSSKSTTDLWINLSPEDIAAIQAREAAAERAEAAERLQQTITQIIKNKQAKKRPNRPESGTFKRQELGAKTAEEK